MRKKAAVLTQCVHIMLYIHNWKSLTKPEDRIGGTARERPMQKETTAAFSYTLVFAPFHCFYKKKQKAEVNIYFYLQFSVHQNPISNGSFKSCLGTKNP